MANANPQTEEQIKTILRIKDFYQVLGIGRDADEAVIKNAYKKLALKFHPDKNKAAGARQAFNKVSTAYTTLIDKDKRANYDRFGSQEDIMREQANRQQQYHQEQAGFNDHFDEFDFIFRQFFGGGVRAGNDFYYYRTRPPQQQRQQQAQQGNRLNPIHALFLFVILMTFLPQFFESKPYFSLNQTYQYSNRRHTAVLRALFFVRTQYFDYIKNNDARRLQIDQQVQREVMKKIYNDCENQKALKRKYMQLARQGVYNREAYAQAAENLDMSSCNKMQHYQSEFTEYLNSLF